jgi:hypothetical protein
VAFLYVFIYQALYLGALKMSVEGLMLLSLGLTIFWFITMLPFVLLVTPTLIRATSIAFPNIVDEEIRLHSLKNEMPKKAFGLALTIPGLIMLLTGLAVTFSPFGDYLAINFAKTFTPSVMELLQLLFYGSGAVLSILGLAVLGAFSFTTRSKTPNSAKN